MWVVVNCVTWYSWCHGLWPIIRSTYHKNLQNHKYFNENRAPVNKMSQIVWTNKLISNHSNILLHTALHWSASSPPIYKWHLSEKQVFFPRLLITLLPPLITTIKMQLVLFESAPGLIVLLICCLFNWATRQPGNLHPQPSLYSNRIRWSSPSSDEIHHHQTNSIIIR